MRNLSPAIKAVITAGLMIIASLIFDKWHEVLDPRIQYLVYLVYLGGIIWSLMAIRGSFGLLFSTGFRHFIVVTIIMVCFTYVFVKMRPELAEQEKAATINYYQQQGDKTPPEIQEAGEKAKKQYPLAIISFSIFRYLIIGAALTAGTALILSRRK